MFRMRIATPLLAVVTLIASCKDATQVSVLVRTNVPYERGNGIAVWASRSGAHGVPLASAAEAWLADGEIGNVVVVPGDGPKDGKLTVRVAMGLRGKPAAQCTDDADASGCIIARRKLSFVPRAGLRVPVVMYLACEGVKCSEDSTCSHLGQCVPAELDPKACATAEGCLLPGEPPFEPRSIAAPNDASADIRVEVGAAEDAGTTDAGAADAGPADAGPADAGATGIQITAGIAHTCVRLDDGTAKCWGANAQGQLGLGDALSRGDGPNEMGGNLPFLDLGVGRSILQVNAGFNHTCARLDDGTVKCWGAKGLGQLGLGDTQSRGDGPNEMGANLATVDLGIGRTAKQLAAGQDHTCALLDDATVKCWGGNIFGQLGLGDTQPRGDAANEMGTNLPPLDFGAGRSAVELTVGANHACAHFDNGAIKCWGNNASGQLGLGDAQARGDGPNEMGGLLATVDLGAGRKVVQLTAAVNHTCARLDNATVKCWGANSTGQLGLGDTQTRGTSGSSMGANLPTVDLGVGRIALHLTAGFNHTCARIDDSTVKCWGRNLEGQLGLGDILDHGSGLNQMGDNLPPVQIK